MKLAGGNQPITEPSSNLAGMEQIESSLHEIEPSKRNQTRLKQDCLQRDGFRCSISGHYDWSSLEEGKVALPADGRLTITQCAHILPFALSDFDERVATETRNKAIIWFALHRYFPELRDKIDTSTINNHANLITMDASLHSAFGQYRIGFWPAERVRTHHRRHPALLTYKLTW